MRALRWLPLVVVSGALFVAALSGDVYNATSPPAFSFHVALRKGYSVIAFAVVGAAYAWGRGRPRAGVLDAALAVGLYSGAIEIGQWFMSEEPLVWNLVDVVCGGLGGALGAAALNRRASARARSGAGTSAARTPHRHRSV